MDRRAVQVCGGGDCEGLNVCDCALCKNMNVWLKTDSDDMIRLIDGNTLEFDSSGEEYHAGIVVIKFCPLCGRKLKAEE